jgi:hypothetical protein
MDDWFYPDGVIKVERHTLHRDGWTDMKIRKILGDWEYLAYTSANFDEHWVKLNLTEEQIQNNIRKYE